MKHRLGLCSTMELPQLRFLTGLVLLWLAPFMLAAQDDLNVHGVVSDAISSSKVDGVEVVVLKDGNRHNSFTTRANGKYEFYLDVGSRYEFKFSKEGYVTRSIVIDSRNIPQEVLGAGIIMPTDMSMYEITPAMEDADLSVFDKPIGMAFYDPAQADLVWDFAYTSTVRNEINSVMRALEKKQKELEKLAENEAKEAAKKQAQFDDFVSKGNSAMSKSNFEDAVLNYQAALKIFPDESDVAAKLQDAREKWNAVKEAQKLEADYNAALDAGDGFMRSGELAKAVTSYQTALELKPGEKYPQEQIDEANRLLEEQAANRAKQEEFNDLMAQADKLASDKEYEGAIGKYDEALAVLPGNQEAESKRGNAQKALDAQRQAEKMRADFDALVAEADQLFNQENFEQARTKYLEASKMIPDEEYPITRAELAQAKIDELAEAQKKQADFDALMASGIQALEASNYQEAIGDFEGATELFPNDATAKSRLEEARGLYAEMVANQEKRENYDAAIAAGDEAFNAERYEEAKSKFEEARSIFPTEEYPTSKIADIDRILAEMAEAKAVQQAYENAMQSAVAAMQAEKYSEAVGHYDTALAAVPGDEAATRGKQEAQAEYEAQMAAMESREAYDALISSADAKFGSENWQAAIADYEAAGKILPEERYPTDQIALINAKIEEEKAREALEVEFNQWVEKGDGHLGESAFNEAIDAYTRALDLMESAEVQNKLAKAQADLAAWEAKQDTEERYLAAIQSADRLFDEGAYERAKADYQKAGDLKPEEQYPKDRIALADQKLAEIAAEESEKLEREKTERVNALVAQGDEAAGRKDFDTAIDRYTEALEILPDRRDVADKLAQAEKDLLATQEKLAVDEAYADALAEADGYFDGGDWERAIGAYEDALEIKAGEKYPLDRIALAQTELQKLAEQENMESQRKVQRDFEKLMTSGDRSMARGQFEDAVEDYGEALTLIPDDATARQKLDEANAALANLMAGKADLERYEAKIREADELYDEESYEMAKLGYLDASEIMPDRQYPKDRVIAIDLLLEKQRLEAEKQSALAERASYDDAIRRGDRSMTAQKYEEAREAYLEAIGILPDEVYPKSQLERIDLLIKESAVAAADSKSGAKQGNPQNSDRQRERDRVEYNRVNADSEDQAEQFMREAREAQRKERYERIKKLKNAREEEARRYAESSREMRQNNLDSFESVREQTALMRAEAQANQNAKIDNSEKYKAAIEINATKRSEMERMQIQDGYDAVVAMEAERKNSAEERTSARQNQMKEVRAANVAHLTRITSWQRENYEERKSVNEAIREEAERRREARESAKDRRMMEATEIRRRGEDHRDFISQLNKNNRVEIKKYSEEMQENREKWQSRGLKLNLDKVEAASAQAIENRQRFNNTLEENKALAEERRKENLEELRNLKTGHPKSADEYHRSQLARDYPQGVTEESSTMGNKVIITRVVVKGNRGDEYKKVVDQAGNYYFKNGQSISRFTWDQETLFAFDKSKD